MNLDDDIAVVRTSRLASLAASGSGRSTSFIPAVPAAGSVTTIAFIRKSLPVVVLVYPRFDVTGTSVVSTTLANPVARLTVSDFESN
jgi:hypothetical protein